MGTAAQTKLQSPFAAATPPPMQIDEFDREVYKAIAAGLLIAAVFLLALYVLAQWIYPSPAPRETDPLDDRGLWRRSACADKRPVLPPIESRQPER